MWLPALNLIKINVATDEGNGCLGYLAPGPHIWPLALTP